MKGGVGGEQIFFKELVSTHNPNVSFETIINYESLKISFLFKNKKPKIFKIFYFNANNMDFNHNTYCEQFNIGSNILPMFHQGIYYILEENSQEMRDPDKNFKLKNFMKSLLSCMNKHNNPSGSPPSAPPRP